MLSKVTFTTMLLCLCWELNFKRRREQSPSAFFYQNAPLRQRDALGLFAFYEVPFFGGVANRFVGVLEELMSDLAGRSKEQLS